MTSPQPLIEAEDLCDTCLAVLDTFDTVPGGSVVGITSQRLEDRAAQGCRLCRLLLGTTSGWHLEHPAILVHNFYLENSSRGKIYISYSKEDMAHEYWTLYAILSVESDDSDQAPVLQLALAVLTCPSKESMPTVSFLGDFTGSVESLGLARKWIEDCKANHVQCQETTGSFRPTRLVDIGNTAATHVRLCLGKNLPSKVSYFTLSHCWGKTPMPLRLLKDNLQSMLLQINCDKLPKNFQDAIYIIRNLGGRYLWIDSLCIIQDSDDDWQHEAALMGEVYMNGYCNLSAVAAQDSSVGMLKMRQPTDIATIRTKLRTTCESVQKEVYICDQRLWSDEVATAPLLQRGWVCQERLLSSCNLHFGRTQIFWECNTHTACETFPDGIPLELERYATEPHTKRKGGRLLRLSSSSITHSIEDPSHPIQLWNEIVHLYSACKLTFGSDKLIALGGLAAISHHRFSGRYLAGLWEEYLPFQLLWDVLSTSDGITTPPPSYRAPTWSWASVDCAILFHKICRHCVSLIELVSAHVELIGPSPYGQVKNAYIDIKCFLVPAQLDSCEWLRPVNFQHPIPTMWNYALPAEDRKETFYMIPICAGTYELSKDDKQKHAACGIIIAQDKTRKGCFIRHGYFDLADDVETDFVECCRRFGLGYENGLRSLSVPNNSDLELSSDGCGKFLVRMI